VPITILAPTPEQPFGPGFIVHAKTDFIGPLPPDTQWIAVITDTSDQFQSTNSILLSQSSEMSFVLGFDYRQSKLNISPVAWPFFQDATARLLVQIDAPSTGFHESASVQITLDNTTGIPYLQQIQTELQGQAGMTEEEHTWLDTTQQAVQTVFADVQGVISSTPLGTLLQHPDHNFLLPFLAPFDLEGRGELIPPSQAGIAQSYGILFQVTRHPPGFGVRDGAVQEWMERIAQLSTLHSIRNSPTMWVTEVLAIHIDTGLWLYDMAGPARILYDVTPGCTLHCEWVGYSVLAGQP
jgi:hypothetical protein